MADGSDEHALLLQISYDLARLQKQGQQAGGVVDKGLSDIERRAKKTAQTLEDSFSLKNLNFKNLEAGLGNALNSSRLAVFDAASSKIGGVSAALEGLGASGLIAAGGIAAAGLALDQAMKAGEWALELTHASAALGLTTTQLQQYRLVAAAGGVDSEKFAQGIAGISKTIGNLESGLIRGKQLQEFVKNIGISPEQLRSWGTLQQQLPHVLDAMAKLDPQERAGLAARFKIDPETLDSIVELRGDLEQAGKAGSDFGIVNDATVRKAADLQKQMKLTGSIIDGEFRIAFINAQGPIVALQELLGRFASGLVNVENGFHRFAYNVTLDAAYISGHIGAFFGGGDPNAGVNAVYRQAQAPGMGNRAGDALGNLAPHEKPPKLVPGAGGRAHADHEQSKSQEGLDAADKLLADAEKALATSFEARAKFESDAIDAEEAKAQTKLSADLKAAKTGPERAAIEKAQTQTAQAFVLKRELLANQLAQQIADQANAIATLSLQGQGELLRAQDALGGTVAQHNATALKIFDLEQQIEQSKLQETIDSKTASDAEKARAQLQLDNLNASAGPRRQAVVNSGAIDAADAADDLRQQALQTQIDQLDAEKGLFQTTERRRQIALSLFSLDEQIQEDKLKQQIADATLAGQAEKAARLQDQLASLQSTAGARGQAVNDANPGNAWQAWVQDAKQAAADVGQSFAQMKVDAIDSFNDSLFDSEGRLNSFASIARKVGQSFVTDAEKWGVKSIEAGIFGGGGGPDGSKSANPLTSAGGFLGKLFGLGGGKGAGGVTQPTGTADDPIYVSQVDPSTTGASAGGPLGNILGSLFGGGGKSAAGGLGDIGGGISSGLSSIMSIIPGFAGGGSFMVGGAGGVDKNLAMLKVSRNERVTIETPEQQQAAQQGGIGMVHQVFNFPGANPDGFRRSQRQVARQTRVGVQYGMQAV